MEFITNLFDLFAYFFEASTAFTGLWYLFIAMLVCGVLVAVFEYFFKGSYTKS